MRSRYRFPALIFLILLLMLSAKAYYDTNSIEVRHYRISNSPLGNVLSGVKIAFFSDLHARNIGARERKALEILNSEKPDLILVSGDLIGFAGPYGPALTFLNSLKPPLGIFAVLGNTEYSNENESCILCHQERSKRLKEKGSPYVLRNSSIPLSINGKVVNIVGTDDSLGRKNDLHAASDHMERDGPSILLAHSPEIAENAARMGFDLLLCGHTHGGQVFLIDYLRRILPLDPAFAYIAGFFHQGKTLMYVSRGIGTSFLPFRLGPRPEIAFFEFDPPASGPSKRVEISNAPPRTMFAGIEGSSLYDTFNIFPLIYGHIASKHRSNSNLVMDFESEADLKRLSAECRKWLELSDQHFTSGKKSLKVSLPPGQFPGINFAEMRSDWSKFRYLKMDLFNPSGEKFDFHIRIDDDKSGWEYPDRFDVDIEMRPGMNHISIPMDSMRTNGRSLPLNLARIERMMVFVPGNDKRREMYLDHIRLE